MGERKADDGSSFKTARARLLYYSDTSIFGKFICFLSASIVRVSKTHMRYVGSFAHVLIPLKTFFHILKYFYNYEYMFSKF
jgi:hypothetical protein